MDQIKAMLAEAQFNTTAFWYAAGILCAGTILLACVSRVLFGKRATLNQAISASIGILFIYALCIVLYSAGMQFSGIVTTLPFINITGSNMSLFSFSAADYTLISSQLLSMVILAFIANLVDGVIPKGKNLFSWLFLRCVSIVCAIALHYGVVWLFTHYLPEGLVTYAPVILLGLLILLLLVGALKYLVGILLATASPLIGAFYTFFFATVAGKALTKAMLTTAILASIVMGLHAVGISVISIATAALFAYIPLLIVLLVIWYIISRLL